VESTGCPLLIAGLKRILLAAATAASSRPCPRAANHSLYLHVAVSREQNLQQTCPSSFKSRASWCRPESVSLNLDACCRSIHGQRFGDLLHRLLGFRIPTAVWLPRFASVSSVATPEPKSALATVPFTPLAPPEPLPWPGPTGKSKDPICAATSRAPVFPSPLSPLGRRIRRFELAQWLVHGRLNRAPVKAPVWTMAGSALFWFSRGGAIFASKLFELGCINLGGLTFGCDLTCLPASALTGTVAAPASQSS